jgi:hypothetical protein
MDYEVIFKLTIMKMCLREKLFNIILVTCFYCNKNFKVILPSAVSLVSHLLELILCPIVPVTTAWRVLRLRMEERPPDMEGSCEYIE